MVSGYDLGSAVISGDWEEQEITLDNVTTTQNYYNVNESRRMAVFKPGRLLW